MQQLEENESPMPESDQMRDIPDGDGEDQQEE